MRMKGRFLVVSGSALLLAGGLLLSPRGGAAADDKELREEILKLADAEQEKGGNLSQQADAIGKKAELEDIMSVFRLRTKKGLGVGATPGAVKPDGIEAQVMSLGKRPLPASQLSATSHDLARAAYVVAAVADIIRNKCPVDKKQGEKDPASWQMWTQDMHQAALDMAAAAQAKQPKQLQMAANKLNSTCNNCHGVFRD